MNCPKFGPPNWKILKLVVFLVPFSFLFILSCLITGITLGSISFRDCIDSIGEWVCEAML